MKALSQLALHHWIIKIKSYFREVRFFTLSSLLFISPLLPKMKSIFILFALSIFNMQSQSPVQVVQKQLDAYNQRDIAKFMETMSQDVVLYNFKDGALLAKGFEDVKAMYTNLFEQSPKLHSDLTNRMVLGNQVIDHESIRGRMGSAEVIELIVIYEVKEGKIFKISVLRK